MSRLRLALTGALAAATLLSGAPATPRSAQAQRADDFVITSYELTVALKAASRDARVTLDITYAIQSGTKADGFKFIGQLRPTDVTGEEEDGRPMQMVVERERETVIRWRFTPTGRGDKRVLVHFTLPAFVAGDDAASIVAAPWAGIFKVRVERALYRLLLPDSWPEGTIISQPAQFTRTFVDGHPALEIEQRPLQDATFAVTLRPGIIGVAGGSAGSALVAPTPDLPDSSLDVENLFFWAGVVLVIGAFIAIAARANRSKRHTSGAPGTSGCSIGGTGSSCASGSSASSDSGGSSCSSGCGGGGCGG